MTVSVDRRPIIVSAAAGIGVLALAGVGDRLLLGVFVCAGMALGWLNGWLTRVAAARIASDAESGRQRLAATTGLRLFAVTVFALLIGVLARPDGLGILFGLVVFQIIAAIGVAVPVPRGAR
ncbi:hypothetical protein NDR87_12730 [Nocardia sp. CDC159]|uniref:ATP synthase subunit I n=1 Tax=Nocardia pulmonis TaxID=2951408 RepID=A0A9X2IW98_9NOCA|nr:MULTISPECIES: hypothetical protein [Nocardia]MCM6774712.1 hypothetical protein [Nocardia pulmonis]MCM6787223.1 hypothetical protein [Nocardia sp. CDC159]